MPMPCLLHLHHHVSMIHVNRARQSGCKQPFDNRRGGRRWYTEGYAANLGEQQMRRDRTCRKRRPPGTTGTARTLFRTRSSAAQQRSYSARTAGNDASRHAHSQHSATRPAASTNHSRTASAHMRTASATGTNAHACTHASNAPKRLPPTVSATRNPLPRRSRATFPRSTACARLPCSASSRITWAWHGHPAACLASRCSSSCPATLLPAFC